jgi:hypothetical protein
VPRLIPALGLIGAPLLIASATIALFRGNDPVTALAAIATVPILCGSFRLASGWLSKASQWRSPLIDRLVRQERSMNRDVVVAVSPDAPAATLRLIAR